MNYGSQTIQQQRRLIEVGQKERIITPQHGKSARVRFKSEDQKKRNNERHREIRKLRRDGLICPQKITKIPNWVQCVKCFAKIGIGSIKSSKLIGVNPSSVSTWRKRLGIIVDKPTVNLPMYRATSKNTLPTNAQANAAYRLACISDINSHKRGFDWGCLWHKKYTYKNNSYHKLTPDQKKKRNARCLELRKHKWKIDPSTKKRDLERMKEWREKNPNKYKDSTKRSIKKRKIIDPGFRIQCNMRNRLKEFMLSAKNGGTASIRTLIGCSTIQLTKHLESKFTKRMTWQNYGTYWHVDHILPCSSFDHRDTQQVAQCWHWTNLRPLEAKKNMDKSDSITEPQMSLLLCATY